MKDIEKLPEEDRFKAIEAVLGRVNVRHGLAAEQYLRSRIHMFFLIGFLAMCGTVALVSASAFVSIHEQRERAVSAAGIDYLSKEVCLAQ